MSQTLPDGFGHIFVNGEQVESWQELERLIYGVTVEELDAKEQEEREADDLAKQLELVLDEALAKKQWETAMKTFVSGVCDILGISGDVRLELMRKVL